MTSIQSKIDKLCDLVESQHQELQTLRDQKRAEQRTRAESALSAAINAGRIAPADTRSKAFWLSALLRDHQGAVKALAALPANPVLATITGGADPKTGLLDKMQLQQKKLAEVRAAHPQADFQTIFAKAQTEAPDLFR